MRRILSALLIAGSATALTAADGPRNLLSNGDMEVAGGNGSAKDWGGRHMEEPGNRLLRLAPGASAVNRVPVTGMQALRFSCAMRCTGVAADAAVLRLDFQDATGRVVRPGPAHPRCGGGEGGWQRIQVRCVVPSGATMLAVSPLLPADGGGTCDLDEVQVVPMDARDIPLVERNNGEVLVDAGKGPPSALRVDGARLVDAAGQAVWLQGLAVPGPEDAAILPAVVTAIEGWRANAVRIPLRRALWEGAAGAAYRERLAQAVLAASSRRAWCVLAPDGDALTAAPWWRTLATRFKDEAAVAFAGGAVAEGVAADAWQAAVRALVATVRDTGAGNVLIIGGQAGGYDLSTVPAGLAGVAFETRVAVGNTGWQARFLATAERHPVVVMAVGGAAADGEEAYRWAPELIACIQARRLHWFAQALDTKAVPSLILDATGFKPTPWWGSFVRVALNGAGISAERLR